MDLLRTVSNILTNCRDSVCRTKRGAGPHRGFAIRKRKGYVYPTLLIRYVYGVRLYHDYSILPPTRVRTRENAKLQRTATPDHLRDFGRHGAMSDRLPPPGRRSGGSSGQRLPDNHHPCRCARSRRTPARVPPLSGADSCGFIFLSPVGFCRHLSCVSFGKHVPFPHSVRFCPENERGVRFIAKTKTPRSRARPGLPGPPSVFLPLRNRAGDATDELLDRLRIPDTADRSAAAHLKPSESGAASSLSGKRLSATKYLRHSVS